MNKGRFPNFWSIVFRSFYCSRISPFHRLYPPLTKAFKFSWNGRGFNRPLLATIPTVFALKFIRPSKEDENKAKESEIIKTADELYNGTKYGELHEFLCAQEETDNPEILWRLARAIFEKSRNAANDGDRLKDLECALSCVEKALEINDFCWAAHKWKAILLDYVWRYKSIKGRLERSFEVKKHMDRAVELNPKDATTYYMIGEWCFTFADLPWYQRKTAEVIFASPPRSTFEEAYSYFEKAEQVDPAFYSMNWLMLAKCLLKMNRKEEAVQYLQQAYDHQVVTPDDEKTHEEAKKLLKNLGYN